MIMRRLEWIVIACCIALVWALAVLSDDKRGQALDELSLAWVCSQTQGWIGEVLLQTYRFSGVGFTGLLVAIAMAFLLLKRWWAELGLLVMASGGILMIVDVVLKPMFGRSRPDEKLLSVDGKSFPSGHAAGSVAFYFALVAILGLHYPRLRQPLALLASLWIAMVWLGSLHVRAHWPSDLIAGGAVGLAWLTLCLACWRSMRNLRKYRASGAHSTIP